MAEVALQNVTKQFGEVTAVKNLSLTIQDGEFLVLLGPTGAGKTTTLRLVAGLESLTSGNIFINKIDESNTPSANRDVAFVFQQYSLYPHYSVYENLAFPLRSPRQRLDETSIKNKVHEIAELLRITDKLQNKATELSGGEMQRVALGRALVRNPQIFLMDEPLSSLDAKLREDLRIELKRIQADLNATIFYVTHDQIEAMTLADRIGVLSKGSLIQVGTPREIYSQPKNIYVAQRLGTPPINILNPNTIGIKELNSGTKVCVRPEDIYISESGQPAKIIQIEHIGAEIVLLLECNGEQVRALSDVGEILQLGATINISAYNENILYFNSHGDRIEDPR